MQYIRIQIPVTDVALREQLIALLAVDGFEAFEESDTELLAYVQDDQYNKEEVTELLNRYQLGFQEEVMQQQNWNAQWESSFEPVIVPGFCTVRATFHDMKVQTPHEIVITPKMSFGTGHHATTQLMIDRMQHLDFKGKKVFDFGTGTGILAILADQLGAADAFAVDNDEWSYENAIENVQQNNASHVRIGHGSIDLVGDEKFDVILANINRHILLEYMNDMYRSLNAGGKILMSGLLTDDFDIIRNAATAAGFSFIEKHELNNWIVLLFAKSL